MIDHLKGVPNSVHDIADVFRVTQDINLRNLEFQFMIEGVILPVTHRKDHTVAGNLLLTIRELDGQAPISITCDFSTCDNLNSVVW